MIRFMAGVTLVITLILFLVAFWFGIAHLDSDPVGAVMILILGWACLPTGVVIAGMLYTEAQFRDERELYDHVFRQGR